MWISQKLWTERDRRYAEVAAARAEALKIKQRADATALDLARQIQTYKDEKANELRSQIESERGMYLTRKEYEENHKALFGLISRNNEDLVALRGERVGVRGFGGVLVSIIAILVSLSAVVAIVLSAHP